MMFCGKYYIASVSWGKDSTAMLFEILRNDMPIDEVVYFDTGMEFSEIYKVRDKMLPLLQKHGVKYTELHAIKPFKYYMLEHLVRRRDGNTKKGYGWCGGVCRWFTTEKVRTINSYYKMIGFPIFEYIGIAFDEPERYSRLSETQLAPLYALRITEHHALRICYRNGIDYGGLYNRLDRVSCWCCRNKNLHELNAYRLYYPEYFNALCELERQIGEPMKPPYYLNERDWTKYNG